MSIRISQHVGKQHLLYKITLYSILIIVIFGCQATPTTVPTILSPTETMTPVPTVTPTLIYQPEPISFENPREWHFTKPYVFEEWPKLIVPDGDTLKLVDNFEVESIELSYQWFGRLSQTAFNYQQIQKIGDTYKLAGKVVLEEKIVNLMSSIKNLHPVPQMVSLKTHYDDYPIWAIEIEGENGTKILLTSRSNALPYLPWNFIYNGQIYAQYDGSVFAPLVDLFEVEEGHPITTSFPSSLEKDKVFVNGNRLPSELNDGFLGLLTMHKAFDYEANASAGEINGVVYGRSSIGGFGNMIIGSIIELEEITLEKGDGGRVNCPVERLEDEYYPSNVQWSFICSAEEPNADGSYLYSVKVSFRTDKGERVTSEGVLFGDWNRGILIPQVAFPPEIQKILDGYEPYIQLRKNHEVLLLSFDTEVDTVKGRLDEAFNADILLFGQLAWDGMTIPYTINTSMGIKNGNIVRWDVDSYELQTLLTDVLRQPITRNILNHEQEAVLNLYHYKSSKGTNIEYFPGSTLPGKHSTRVAPCEGVPWREELPDENTPLRGFDFNRNWEEFLIHIPQFVLLDGSIRVLEFNDGFIDNSDSFLRFLLPSEFHMDDEPPLKISGKFDFGPYIRISWSYDTAQEDKDVYLAMIEQLPGIKEFEDGSVTIENAIFVVNDEGTFNIVDCR